MFSGSVGSSCFTSSTRREKAILFSVDLQLTEKDKYLFIADKIFKTIVYANDYLAVEQI